MFQIFVAFEHTTYDILSRSRFDPANLYDMFAHWAMLLKILNIANTATIVNAQNIIC